MTDFIDAISAAKEGVEYDEPMPGAEQYAYAGMRDKFRLYVKGALNVTLDDAQENMRSIAQLEIETQLDKRSKVEAVRVGREKKGTLVAIVSISLPRAPVRWRVPIEY